MSSHPRPEPPDSTTSPRVAGDSSAQAHELPPVDDILSAPMPPTDDTPTIITRHVAAATQPAPPSEDPGAGIRGRRLAHFELIEPIGVGGMAAVLRARDTQLDRLVALKILPPETAGDVENVRRFHQEARSAAKLDHENIARVFFCGEDQRLHFIAFEFVEGENLRALLDRRGRLPVAEAIHYMLQIAAGLAHASRRGVVHRDIKPSNIIITPNGRAKLVDMGLARTTERQDNDDLTQSGVTLGTFDYISPEQALEPREADARSDIYSLGCTFYHVLTGRAPVPEGTAAKKLHHHQHVKPTDPRQFVPDLPLEVVQILDRMMAKNPRDRMQTPEELVHQLLVTAKKLGANPEVPEGLLTFEATLPRAPAGRPLVWAAIAAALVIGLVLVLDQAPSGPPGQSPSTRPGPEASDGKSAGKSVAATRPSEDEKPIKGGESTREESLYEAPEGLDGKQLARHLVAWLRQQGEVEQLTLVLVGELDLSLLQTELQTEATFGLTMKAARKVSIRPKLPGGVVTIRFNYDSGVTTKSLVALTLQAKETSIEGVRFVVDAHVSQVELTALRLVGDSHNIQRCVFLQAQPSPGLASVHADASAGSLYRRSVVTLRDCAFLGFGKRLKLGEGSEARDEFQGATSGGQVAIVRDGGVRITAQNCVFGPHAAMVRVLGNVPDAAGQVLLQQCSLLLAPRRSSAFEVSDGATGLLGARGCLIARAPGEAGDGAVLIRQMAEGNEITYQGAENSYHDLDGYWLVRDRLAQASWGDFRSKVGNDSENGDKSRITLCCPWQADPAEQVRLLEQVQLAKAFELNLRLGSLRRPGRVGTEVVGVVGATRILGENWLPDTLPPIERKTDGLNRRLLVVEDGYNDPDNGVYDSLEEAVRRGRPYDTIALRVNGVLKIDPVQLNKAKDLTIRPARKFTPTLKLGAATEQDVALFRVFDGTLRLEGLEFRLEPEGGDFKAQAVVALAGDGMCLMRDCVVTMGKPGETNLALAMLVESSKVMKSDMPPARPRDQGPKLAVKGCLVRGEGDLLWGRVNRPFALEMEETLAALSGSLVNFEVGPDATATPEGQHARVQLRQSTTYLGGHLLHVNVSKDPRAQVPVRCNASGCLFLPATTGKTLVQLEGPEGEEKALRDKFSWEGGHNGYGAYTSLLAQESGDGMATPMGMEKWKMLPGEDASTFGVKMEALPPKNMSFAAIDLGQFKIAGDDASHLLGASRRRAE